MSDPTPDSYVEEGVRPLEDCLDEADRLLDEAVAVSIAGDRVHADLLRATAIGVLWATALTHAEAGEVANARISWKLLETWVSKPKH